MCGGIGAVLIGGITVDLTEDPRTGASHFVTVAGKRAIAGDNWLTTESRPSLRMLSKSQTDHYNFLASPK